MVKIKDKTTLILILTILSISLFLNIHGIEWGLPMKWHPDERVEVDSVKNMARHLDPNPHDFLYPSFHKYLIGIALSPYFLYLTLSDSLSDITIDENKATIITNMYLISRLVSVIMGTATVFLIYLIGKDIYNKKVGLISSSFLACTMGFVNLSHFATVDISLTFWIIVSIFFLIKIADTGKNKYYLLGGFFAGLALSTKYTAILLILPMFISHLLFQIQKWQGDAVISIFARKTYSKLIEISFYKKFFYGVIMMGIGFIIGTPFSIIDFTTFKWYVFSQFFIRWQGYKGFSPGSPSWVSFIFYLKNAMSLPLLLICSFGVIYLIIKFSKKDKNEFSKSKYTILLLSWIIPNYIVLGSMNVTDMRYIIPIIPILVLFGGKFVFDMMNSTNFLKKISIFTVFCIILIYSFCYSFAADYMFVHDSRYAAGDWIGKNVDINSTIEVYGYNCYLPYLPKNVKIFYPPYPDIGNPSNHTYIEKYDNFLKAQEERKPDYIVLTSFYYERYFRDSIAYPYRTMFFSNLVYGKTNYTTIATFGNKTISNQIPQIIEQPSPEFVNPTILILKRKDMKEPT